MSRRRKNPLQGEGLLIGAALGAGAVGLWVWWTISSAQSTIGSLTSGNTSNTAGNAGSTTTGGTSS